VVTDVATGISNTPRDDVTTGISNTPGDDVPPSTLAESGESPEPSAVVPVRTESDEAPLVHRSTNRQPDPTEQQAGSGGGDSLQQEDEDGVGAGLILAIILLVVLVGLVAFLLYREYGYKGFLRRERVFDEALERKVAEKRTQKPGYPDPEDEPYAEGEVEPAVMGSGMPAEAPELENGEGEVMEEQGGTRETEPSIPGFESPIVPSQ
jgi:hypothetical protein